MKLIRGSRQLTRILPGSVVTIGNFDGVHLGHQVLLQAIKEQAHRLGVPTVVLSFEPHPQEFFLPARNWLRILLWREKWQALADSGIDYFVCLHFDQAVARLPPDIFVKDMLLTQLGMRAIVVGEDFRFGSKRAGDVAMLRLLGEERDFSVTTVPDYLYNGERVSSSVVRHYLQAGDLQMVATLLGRPYDISGCVVPGDHRGHQLAMPTANLLLRQSVALSGVYIVEVLGVSSEPWAGVASVGTNLTFHGECKKLEVHLLDFSGDLYEQRLTIRFLSKIRDEKFFDQVDDLKQRMQEDAAVARSFFAKRVVQTKGGAEQ